MPLIFNGISFVDNICERVHRVVHDRESCGLSANNACEIIIQIPMHGTVNSYFYSAQESEAKDENGNTLGQ